MESKIKHLEMIQAIISRLASNSSQLKRWCIALLTGIIAIMQLGAFTWAYTLCLFSIVVLWFMDSYYLQLERKYRGLYDKVRLLPEGEINFSMDISDIESDFKSALFSKVESAFYIVVMILTCIAIMSKYLA